MNIVSLLQSILYLIMNALLVPVMVLLVFSLILALFHLGVFLAEYSIRRDVGDEVEHLAQMISNNVSHGRFLDTSHQIRSYTSSSYGSRVVKNFLKDLSIQVSKGAKDLDIHVENILQEHEIGISKSLDKMRVMVRVGPILGLMGTLIPMGGALLALSKGDLMRMSNSLIIAFSTTVVGLAVAGVAYVISVVRERWYEQDMKNMEYLTELVIRNINKTLIGGQDYEIPTRKKKNA